MSQQRDLFEQLNDQQREAVLYTSGPLLILAGAGSGKTKVLTCKIAHLIKDLGISPAQILAMTFSNKASEEMAHRVEQMTGAFSRHMWMGTFHSIGSRILRTHAEKLGYRSNFSIFNDDDQANILKDVLANLNISTTSLPVKQVEYWIDQFKNSGLLPNQVELTPDGLKDQRVLACYAAYQEALRENNGMDFGDLILLPMVLFEQHPEVLADYRSRFEALFIDEYQDTNHAQFRFFQMLAEGKALVTVVGDDDQSIYRWRGADITNILTFPKIFSGAKVLKLERNYRSTKPILEAAHRVVSRNRNRYDKELFTENEGVSEVGFLALEDEQDEAESVYRRISAARLDHNIPCREIAVFYRTNAQSRVLEECFVRRGLPYRIVGGQKFFDRMEIKDVLAYLRCIANPADSVSFRRVVNVPARGIGKATVQKLDDEAKALGISLFEAMGRASANELPGIKPNPKVAAFYALMRGLMVSKDADDPLALLEKLIKDTDYRTYIRDNFPQDADSRLENVDELANSLGTFLKTAPQATLEQYLERTCLLSDADNQDFSNDRVTLMTVHCSKGLEFDVVFMVGMEEGLFPHQRSKSEAEIEEERRLCYVGMTRAKRYLTMSYCRRRRTFGAPKAAFPSFFLHDAKKSSKFGGLSEKTRYDYTERAIEREREREREPEDEPSPQPNYDAHYNEAYEQVDHHADEADHEAQELAVGMKVKHPVFGVGQLKHIEGSGQGLRLTIYFVGFGVKKIAPSYTPVRIVG